LICEAASAEIPETMKKIVAMVSIPVISLKHNLNKSARGGIRTHTPLEGSGF